MSLLLCEGEDNSPDVRVLRAVLRSLRLEVRPSGGKGGLAALVRGLRGRALQVCGIIDGDFPRKPDAWTFREDACSWQVRHKEATVMCGWVWRRKEIENYLIDPVVLGRALGWSDEAMRRYTEQLRTVQESIGFTTAARMALTACVPAARTLSTKLLLVDDEAKVQDALRRRASERNEETAFDVGELLATYTRLVPECRPGGRFFAHAHSVFAGKDVLARMQHTPGIPVVLKNKEKLVEQVVDALERAEAPHRWLPEWEALHAAVRDWPSSSTGVT